MSAAELCGACGGDGKSGVPTEYVLERNEDGHPVRIAVYGPCAQCSGTGRVHEAG
jgi:hypothetical protein